MDCAGDVGTITVSVSVPLERVVFWKWDQIGIS